MSILNSLSLRLPMFLIGLSFAFSAQAEAEHTNDAWITRNEMLTAAGQSIPAGAFGILIVERPREVTLLNLRGMGGRGEVILRSDEPGNCLLLPIRFVAGDFGGERISGHLADPIHLIIKSRRVAKALSRAHDIVSDTYRVTGQTHPDADIVLQSGLDESFGFVINPGRNILSDIFGVETQSTTCHPV